MKRQRRLFSSWTSMVIHKMFKAPHDALLLAIDQLEEDEVLKSCVQGYRINHEIFVEKYLKHPRHLEKEIAMIYPNYDFTKKSPKEGIDNRIEYRLIKKPAKQGRKGENFSLRPKFTGNLAVDIVNTIGFNLSGDRWRQCKNGKWKLQLKSYMKIHDIIEELKRGWVFIN